MPRAHCARSARVDHGNAFLDTEALERERGITIFAKQAVLDCGGTHITLLDTPGHVDFSAEAERTLQVLDYAILVISGTDGVQGHTRTLWRLLERYGVPTFLFINKMDLAGADRAALLTDLQKSFGACVDLGAEPNERDEHARADRRSGSRGAAGARRAFGRHARRFDLRAENFPLLFRLRAQKRGRGGVFASCSRASRASWRAARTSARASLRSPATRRAHGSRT